MPEPSEPVGQLGVYLLPLDRARAVVVETGILLLTVPFVVVALRYFQRRPITSVAGLIAAGIFVLLETIHRCLDLVLIGGWARAFQTAPELQRSQVLSRFGEWNHFSHAYYLPLLLSYFVASCCFASTTWTDRARGSPYPLAPIAYALNAVRLLGRMLSGFAGQTWLSGLAEQLYFPAVFVVNALLAAWFFWTASREDGVRNSE